MDKIKTNAKVIVYSTNTCLYCTLAKNFLKEHGITYVEKNVGEDYKAAEEMVRKSGQRGVPVIEIDKKIIVGFDKERLKKIFGIND